MGQYKNASRTGLESFQQEWMLRSSPLFWHQEFCNPTVSYFLLQLVFVLQRIQFTNPVPPEINLPTVKFVACGPDEDEDVSVSELIEQGKVTCFVSILHRKGLFAVEEGYASRFREENERTQTMGDPVRCPRLWYFPRISTFMHKKQDTCLFVQFRTCSWNFPQVCSRTRATGRWRSLSLILCLNLNAESPSRGRGEWRMTAGIPPRWSRPSVFRNSWTQSLLQMDKQTHISWRNCSGLNIQVLRTCTGLFPLFLGGVFWKKKKKSPQNQKLCPPPWSAVTCESGDENVTALKHKIYLPFFLQGKTLAVWHSEAFRFCGTYWCPEIHTHGSPWARHSLFVAG